MRQLGSHGWDHYCLRFVGDAYTSGSHASVHRYETAKQAADALHAAARPNTDAPRGAWVFYHSMHGSTDLGHVGISLGDGTMINDNGGEGVRIMSIAHTAHYIGWAAPPLSPPITDWLEPTKS
jgi:cell wall-associated NlpC family hydrolase